MKRSHGYPIDHPEASLQAAAEELLLIEHHARWRWCPSCIQKHARTAAALVDESVSLSGGAHRYLELQPRFRYVAELADRGRDKHILASAARSLRREVL